MDVLSQRRLACRFTGDTELLGRIDGDESLRGKLRTAAMKHHQGMVRAHLLSHAVRVDARLVPAVAQTLGSLRQRAKLDCPLEAYVYDEASISAFVTRGHSHTLVVLSSGAVNNLTAGELEFVIGHELGHAAFGHLEVAATYLLKEGDIEPRSAMQVLAWQRASEISADRAGLASCGSIEVAATALFKVLSGLNIEGLRIDPVEFAEQWEHLEREVLEGGEEQWQLSHPFPPLRMKAMLMFWESGFFQVPDAGSPNGWSSTAVDAQVSRLLTMMDPLARESKDSADPLLADFFLWGGLYIALSNGELHESELARLATICSQARVDGLKAAGVPDAAACLQRFGECISRRRQRLRALEMHRIAEGLLQVAAADGTVDAVERKAVTTLLGKLGITPEACELVIAQLTEGR